MSIKDNEEKFVSKFVDHLYDDWYGNWLMDEHKLDKKQFKDLLMNTTGIIDDILKILKVEEVMRSKEKVVNSFVDSIYDQKQTWYGNWLMDEHKLDKKQFKDLLMNTTEVDSMDVTKLVCDFNTNQKEISKLSDVMTNFEKLFGIDTWLGDDFSDEVNDKQIGIIDDILKILKVEEVV
jgi:hypothetical protein